MLGAYRWWRWLWLRRRLEIGVRLARTLVTHKWILPSDNYARYELQTASHSRLQMAMEIRLNARYKNQGGFGRRLAEMGYCLFERGSCLLRSLYWIWLQCLSFNQSTYQPMNEAIIKESYVLPVLNTIQPNNGISTFIQCGIRSRVFLIKHIKRWVTLQRINVMKLTRMGSASAGQPLRTPLTPHPQPRNWHTYAGRKM